MRRALTGVRAPHHQATYPPGYNPPRVIGPDLRGGAPGRAGARPGRGLRGGGLLARPRPDSGAPGPARARDLRL